MVSKPCLDSDCEFLQENQNLLPLVSSSAVSEQSLRYNRWCYIIDHRTFNTMWRLGMWDVILLKSSVLPTWKSHLENIIRLWLWFLVPSRLLHSHKSTINVQSWLAGPRCTNIDPRLSSIIGSHQKLHWGLKKLKQAYMLNVVLFVWGLVAFELLYLTESYLEWKCKAQSTARNVSMNARTLLL